MKSVYNLLATATLLLTLLVSPLMAIGLKGHFYCKIQAQNIIQVEEGKASQFPFYKDGLKTGDKFVVKYELLNNTKPIISFGIDNPVFGSSAVVKKDEATPSAFSASFDKEYIYFSTDNIRVMGMMGNIHLKRYYKNDWSGSIYKYWYPSNHVIAVDCRHPIDALEDILATVNDNNN
jgi:hypothetical protein